MEAAILAVDWGSTNRRVFVLAADGTVLETAQDDRGVLAMGGSGFAAEAAAMRARWGDLPMLCAGMVGSNRGWVDAGYVPAPASLAEIATAVHWVEPGRTAIVPGVSRDAGGRADIMRGEEVQLLGAAAAGLVAADSWLCQPGTHAKWARLEQGRLTDFTTAMTGEVFAQLGRGGLLADGLDGTVEDGAAFRAGVQVARGGDLLAKLFGARASLVLGRRNRADQASYVSGLLIGSDCDARLASDFAPARTDGVDVLASPALGNLYLAALDELGCPARLVDSHAAFLAGITQIWSLLQ
ncbi:2-dehydro-3-deoxygalactonokinase [Novosphingobium sp.]|uniref:2-dehydro-3-deoxygalactonokinase n=1 Tax=Novosphingobium sp. TaxID=1874826 RepID=UPI001D735068|nr:2-dehydro-3-deoxygalactonokinase [Novosphingobium sp.]MBX9662114.1 2-dehydro-3-deoxygalactonokinase [Novosphingobium sp.]